MRSIRLQGSDAFHSIAIAPSRTPAHGIASSRMVISGQMPSSASHSQSDPMGNRSSLLDPRTAKTRLLAVATWHAPLNGRKASRPEVGGAAYGHEGPREGPRLHARQGRQGTVAQTNTPTKYALVTLVAPNI